MNTLIEDIFLKTILRQGLIKKRDKLILGVSGGPDSICLLYLIYRLKESHKLYIVCAHFNHGLRADAVGEESFVKEICQELGIRCISETKDVSKFFTGDSLEQTARSLRFDFFLKCSRETRIKKIALAHHKDDLAETVLMRIIRGTGLRGLRGFLPKSKYKNLTVIRPLIEVRKKQIVDWLKKEKIPYCLDKTNFEDKFFRNRLRLEVIPFLEKFNSNIVDNLYNMAVHTAVDYDFLFKYSYGVFQSLRKEETKRDIKIDLEGLKKLPGAVYNNVIRIAIEELKGNIRKIESRHLAELNDLIMNRPVGSVVDLPALLVEKNDRFIQLKLVSRC